MEQPIHNLVSLFKQLGLDNTNETIEDFINRNRPVPSNLLLHEAEFWNASQASFLKEALEEDADWAEIVDELNVLLRRSHA
ncbi:MAG: DUF2789 domain-containing protein [Sulfuriflexus sp.]|nr:DUF2789 domain-containing protein [Sulfuriflexus sp.]